MPLIEVTIALVEITSASFVCYDNPPFQVAWGILEPGGYLHAEAENEIR